MYRYVGVLFTLLAVYDLRTLAAGNIGCLFSDTLCEQDREWCFDDHAFGHCLSDYGHYREEDLHRYDLGSEELRHLEQEMQRLFLLGYRWSHTYTQCVLQTLLHSIRRKSEFDISSCNGDLDQDLEGALRAIEGEELEQVDPRDLAIVRFTPSVTDPHSDYADEVYYPPIQDPLLEDHPGDQPDQDRDHQDSVTSGPRGEGGRTGGGGDKDHSRPPQPAPLPANPPGPPPSSGNALPSVPDDHHQPLDDPRALNYINYYASNRNGYDDEDDDDGDVYQSPYRYQTPVNPVYRKRGMPPLGNSKPHSQSLNNIADILDDMRMRSDRYKAIENRLFPEAFFDQVENEEEDEDEGVFGEAPTRPMYIEGGHQFMPELDYEKGMMGPSPRESAVWSSMPEDLRPLPGRFRSIPEELHNMPGVFDSLQNFPGGYRNREDMRNMPDSLRNFPGLFSRYVPQEAYIPDNMVPENSINRLLMQEEPPFEPSLRDLTRDRLMLEEEVQNQFPRNPPKLSALQTAFGPQLSNLRDYEDTLQDYPEYGLFDDYGDYDQYDEDLLRPNQAFPFQKFVKKDEESANQDYGDFSPGEYERVMRVDVKKPGPNFRSDNSFAFDYKDDLVDDFDEDGGGAVVSRTAVDGMTLPKLREEVLSLPSRGSIVDQDDDEDEEEEEEEEEEDEEEEERVAGRPQALVDNKEVLHLLLRDDVVDGATDDVIPVREQDAEQKRVGEEESGEGDGSGGSSSAAAPTTTMDDDASTTTVTTTLKAPAPPSSFVYINGRFGEEQATMIANEVMVKSGLTARNMDSLSVQADEVAFRVLENEHGITAVDVAKKAEELRDYFKNKLGVEITQSGVGSKTTMSAVVFSSSEKHILAAAAIVCGVMAALLVAATVLFFLRRHAKSKAKLQGLTAHDTEASKDYQDLCRGRMAGKAGEIGKSDPPSTHAPSQRISSLSKDSDNGNNSPSSRSSTSSWSEEPVASNMDISTGHMVLSYMEDHLKNKDRLEQEWIALCAYEAEPCATTLALKPENNQKNRYPDAVPYDHNRVVLNAHANLNGSDYINASSITDHDPRNPAYIATQGPLESTAADFWQLVWEQGSVVIVMLTRLTENGHAFCHRYWPEEGSDLYHIYEVHLVSEHIWCDDYLVRSFYLKNVRTGETRTVTQFHFLSWPDSGTPASTKALLEFRRKVNKSYRGRSCPIIVHCSDGIGRTGTYCLIDMVLNRMAKGAKEIDIAATLEHIRDQRPHMVKSKAQFEFVLMAVAEEVHAILKALPQ